jgi:hypothetical protein
LTCPPLTGCTITFAGRPKARLFLLSEEQRLRLTHIRNSVDNIVLFIGDADFAAYLQDRKTQASVEREFQIISEAAI